MRNTELFLSFRLSSPPRSVAHYLFFRCAPRRLLTLVPRLPVISPASNRVRRRSSVLSTAAGNRPRTIRSASSWRSVAGKTGSAESQTEKILSANRSGRRSISPWENGHSSMRLVEAAQRRARPMRRHHAGRGALSRLACAVDQYDAGVAQRALDQGERMPRNQVAHRWPHTAEAITCPTSRASSVQLAEADVSNWMSDSNGLWS